MAVSIRTTQTAMDTYALLGNNDRTQLKDALRSVYVKNKYDIPKFDDAFESFFVKSLREPKNPQTIHSSQLSRRQITTNKYKMSIQKGSSGKKVQMGAEQILDQLSGTPILEERKSDLARDSELLNTQLTKLNKFDQRVFELCQELGRKIANKQSRRRKLSQSNKIDIHRTMRANMKYGGVPIDLVTVKTKPHKKQHLFLNDVSGSCEWISSWFFMLMFACQFAEIRLKRMKHAMVRGTSDMFSAFSSFMRQADINNKSYIIILSDCRDWSGPKVDGIPASVDLIREMARLGKKVIILNPEEKKKWDVVDSCVSLYQGAGAKVYEVSTLSQLAEFVADI